jgi:hypothetical protein
MLHINNMLLLPYLTRFQYTKVTGDILCNEKLILSLQYHRIIISKSMIAYNDSLSIEEWVGMLLLILLAEYRFDNSFVANVHIILADIGNKNET